MLNAPLADHFRGYRHPFLSGVQYLGGVGDVPRTLSDLAMSQYSAEIRRTPSWWERYHTEDFRNSWHEAALDRVWIVRTPSSHAEVKLTEKQINYILDELGGYAALRDDKAECQVSCFERIWESDSLLDASKSIELKLALDALKSQPPLKRPNDDGLTTDILDPTLYCLIYNRTLVTQISGGPTQPVPPPPSFDMFAASSHVALLPSDVVISSDGKSPTFISYINNLHPDHNRDIYDLLESLLAGFIPLFEYTLTDLHRTNTLVQRVTGRCRYTIWDEPDTPEHSDDEEGWSTYERDMRQWTLSRPINLPDVPETGYPGGHEKRKHHVTLQNKTLQIVVKVSQINLSPQRPSFSDSPWHVEGMRSERIVACGLHCLSSENVVESSIQFRMAVTYPRGFAPGDNGATLRAWGIRDGDSCHQYIGGVPLRPGLSLVFPNIYQHRQTAFSLADPTRAGHITLVWFCLVDPEIKPIISTAVVAPQQKEWIHRALDETLDPRLPNEVIDKILEYVEGLMTAEEAYNHKVQLMEDRDRFTQENNSYHFCLPFDVWNGPDLQR